MMLIKFLMSKKNLFIFSKDHSGAVFAAATKKVYGSFRWIDAESDNRQVIRLLVFNEKLLSIKTKIWQKASTYQRLG